MKLIATIEQGSDGYFAVCVREKPWLLGTGATEQEAKDDFEQVFREQCEFQTSESGKRPDWAEAEIEYQYDLCAFFAAFPFINVSRFAEYVGINPSLMRKYKQGLATASAKQLSLIQNGINAMATRLQSVQL